MKKISALLLGLCFAATGATSITGATGAYAATPSSAKTKNSEVTFHVNYHCHSCLKKIDKNVPFMKGVVNYKANLEEKSLKITYNPDKTNEETLKKEIEKLDFVVTKSSEELKKSTGE